MDLWASLRLQFDIERDPPAEAELARLRRQASPRNLQFTMLCGLAVGVAVAAVFLDAVPWPLPASVPAAVVIALGAALPFLYWAKIADILAGVTHPLGSAEIRAFCEWSERDERIARYFQKIRQQGRRPVYGDFAALVARIGQLTGQRIGSTSRLCEIGQTR